MQALGVRGRTLPESMTKFPKAPFSGAPDDRAYPLGLRAGDLFATVHGRCIGATVSTTHPSMAGLINVLFDDYGHVIRRPKFLRKWNTFEWEVYVYLHPSFSFLRNKPGVIHEPFFAFLAGFFDAEGCINIKPQSGSKTTRISLELSNNNLPLLRLCAERLRSLGYSATIPPRPYHEVGEAVGLGPYNKACWRLSISRRADAISLLSSLKLRHEEKVRKKTMALQSHNRLWCDVAPLVKEFRSALDVEVNEGVERARESYLTKK